MDLRERFKVAPATIRRSAYAVRGLEAIGAISPEAERKIASEEVRVNKQVLQNARNTPEDELAQLARMIEQGTYEKPKPNPTSSGAGSAGTPGTSGPQDKLGTSDPQGTSSASPAGSHPLQLTIFMLMDDLSSELQQVKSDDTARQKTALRSYIDKLEEIYKEL